MAIIDAEGDEVGVDLELYDPELDAWMAGTGPIEWQHYFLGYRSAQQADAQYRINYREGPIWGRLSRVYRWQPCRLNPVQHCRPRGCGCCCRSA